ncbi:acetylornithine deacetylase/succinyl-diaminopimelate desuccinylase-like protein [Hydrogenophaga palleronii]|uniref:Acetylornithine deacetylase/succinyl-diaminopimelate desuccinylase-like protein n=1 Tax=Hydrogenophaga palleronii TaxID=65655 RepID=A0ABU1WHC6_9BURK|nr:M20 family metallopeptidase [Hydrogenophaga palleronii]MDR7148643.1 acetylornithine deacetylase/succinyl-diaminopimelate desuccinylase-like protein [Hydrogenophaga palleronii]
MSRHQAVTQALACFDDGRFQQTLARRVAFRTESQDATSGPILQSYLDDEIAPQLQALGFVYRVVGNPIPGKSPFLLAERIEPGASFTLLTYGHGDVVRGYDAQWREGLKPWELVVEGNRWYGRGIADNKGQHTINLTALEQVIAVRGGKLGYNVKIILEMGEEDGSPGLNEVCVQHRKSLAADVFIASDGPRVSASRATMFLGSRGVFNFDLHLKLREGGHHSGNWGGLLRNPGIRLAHAIASLVDAKGKILVPGLLPRELPDSVRRALKDIAVGGDVNDPEIDPDWGEPGLSASERVIGWNSLEVLAFITGNPAMPVHAIPSDARAHCHMRYVVGSDHIRFLEHIRQHLDAHGFDDVELRGTDVHMAATRLDPDDAWVRWGMASIERSTGVRPALLPNLGGSLPNEVFAETLSLPTLWVPHSYPACSQHAPNEHILADVTREALHIMAGLFWDLAEEGPGVFKSRP